MNRAMTWMAQNGVAANLLMALLIFGGFLLGKEIKQEIFPEISLDMVNVTVVYPGAGPEEVEDSICLAVEEAVSGLNGIKRIIAGAAEGVGSVVIEVLPGEDVDLLVQDVKAEIDRIRTFPQDAERPVITKVVTRRHVLSLVVYGDLPERILREQAEWIRDELLALEEITQVDLTGMRPYEISIEISEETLRKYGLTLDQVAVIVRQASRDMPGGQVRAKGGEILLRTKERRYTGKEYAAITVLTTPGGTQVKLGDIADVRDTFMETDQQARFDGRPAAMLQVYRVGDQTPTEIATVVKQFIQDQQPSLPPSVNLAIWNDRSEILEARLNLLLQNGALGLLLLLMALGVFLNVRLAFWVALGIPISFLGALLLAPGLNVSINMMSLFAFILSLGIVVDDAIIVGENIYAHRQMGKPFMQAAIDGVQEVAGPVVFAVLTSVAAFLPLLFVSGTMGKFIWVIPTIVISVLAISLVEGLFILPAHLGHGSPHADNTGIMRWIQMPQKRFARGLERHIQDVFLPVLWTCLRNRYITIATSVAILLAAFGFIAGGHVRVVFMPEIDAEIVSARLQMPFGVPVAETRLIEQRLVETANAVVAEYEAASSRESSILRNIYSSIGSHVAGNGPRDAGEGASGAHLAEIQVFLVSSDQRDFSSQEFAQQWREKVGEIPGVESLTFESNLLSSGPSIDVQLAHNNFGTLIEAAERLKVALTEYDGVDDIADSYSEGKRELKLRLRPEARTLGITESDLGRQVRAGFYGAEALRLQRGRNEIKVMVRYPEAERTSLGDIEDMRIRTPGGGEVPFYRAAFVEDGRGYSQIERVDRKRVIHVTAHVDQATANAEEILRDLGAGALPQLLADYPGLNYTYEGEQREMAESMESLQTGFLMVLLMIYALLAIPFRSYLQPFIVMSAIPFGMVGAVLGHLLLGYDLSMLSMFGLVALTGILVNDSLILIDFINRGRAAGKPALQAVMDAGARRFRPIVLTSVTTFLGLAPMIAETSIQAQFLIPMAVSLGFGVLLATGITNILIPALYLVLEDVGHRLFPERFEAVGESWEAHRGTATTKTHGTADARR